MKRQLTAYTLMLALTITAFASKHPAQDAKQAQKDAETMRQLQATLKEHEEWKKQHADQLNQSFEARAQTNLETNEYVRLGMTTQRVEELCGFPDHVGSLT